MAPGATLSPDHDHPQIQPPSEVRSAESLGVPRGPEIDPKNPVFILRKKVSSSVSGIIHVAERDTITRNTAEQAKKIGIESEKNTGYKALHEEVDREFVLSKLDEILKKPRKLFLESHLSSLFSGKFDRDNNIIIGGVQIVRKGTPEYKSMITKSLEGLRMVSHAMLRRSEEQGIDPKTLKDVEKK